MIGMILVTHGRLADEFKLALEHVVGPQEHLETVSIQADDDMERNRQDIIAAIERVDDGDGVVILTDLFGGTPSNLALSCITPNHVEVVAGINLPMLIKLTSVRDEPLSEAVIKAQDAGRKHINIASQILTCR